MKSNSDAKFWAIRAGKGGDAHKLFIERGVIALEDAGLGDLSIYGATREQFYNVYRKHHPDETRSGSAGVGGKFFRFIHEISVNDFIVYPALADKQVYVAEVTGEYIFDQSSMYPHQRSVKWTHSFPKSELSISACRELGAARTFFEFKNNICEIKEKTDGDLFLFKS